MTSLTDAISMPLSQLSQPASQQLQMSQEQLVLSQLTGPELNAELKARGLKYTLTNEEKINRLLAANSSTPPIATEQTQLIDYAGSQQRLRRDCRR